MYGRNCNCGAGIGDSDDDIGKKDRAALAILGALQGGAAGAQAGLLAGRGSDAAAAKPAVSPLLIGAGGLAAGALLVWAVR